MSFIKPLYIVTVVASAKRKQESKMLARAMTEAHNQKFGGWTASPMYSKPIAVR